MELGKWLRQMRELLCWEQILQFGLMGSPIWIANRRQENLRCMLVGKLVGKDWHIGRQCLIDETRCARERRVGLDGRERFVGINVSSERILRENKWPSLWSKPSDHCGGIVRGAHVLSCEFVHCVHELRIERNRSAVAARG